MNCHFWAPIWSAVYGRLWGSSEWDKPWEVESRHEEGHSLFICSVEIRLQEILGEAEMPLVRCVLVRWELLVQENLRVIQTHCSQSPWLERSKNCCVWGANVSFLQNLSLGSLKMRWTCTESSGVCQGWGYWLRRASCFIKITVGAFALLNWSRLDRTTRAQLQPLWLVRDPRKCLSSRTCKR